MKNKCDECGSILEKTFIMTAFGFPITCWVCPKSEMYQAYKSDYEGKYHVKNEKSNCKK